MNLRVVTPLREEPPVSDIPGMLRALAVRIESGEISPRTIALIEEDEDGAIVTYGFGHNPPSTHVVGLFARAMIKHGTPL